MNWKVPKIWPNSTVFILGGGPSLLNDDLSLIHKEKVIGVNNAAFLECDSPCQCPQWIDVLWFGDLKWWQWHRHRLQKFRGLIVTCNQKMRKWPKMKTLSRGKPQGIDERPTYVSWNRNSGASAINLAYHFGASRVVLLGFDMRMVEIDGVERKNFHDDHKEKKHNPFARHLKPFPHIAKDANRLGLEIINCTPGSAIHNFPIMPLQDFLNMPEGAKLPEVSRKAQAEMETIVRKTTTMEKPHTIGQGVFIGHFNVFRPNVRIGDFTKIGHQCVFEGDIIIGKHCLIQPQCNITFGTVIEDKVFIGQGVITGNDKRMVHLRRKKVPFEVKAPVIKYGARIGMGSIILPDVTIGRECFIAAGSVVTKTTEPFAIYKGSPARKVGEVPEEERL